MSYSSNNADSDKTVVMPLIENEREYSKKIPPPFAKVAMAHPDNDLYVAQQSSLKSYSHGLNQLTEAAEPLFLELIKLHGGTSEDVNNLRNRLESSIRAFEVRALSGDIDRAQVMAARYVLCTALDETISVSSIGEKGEWSKQALLSTFHNETWGGEKFFQILDRCMQQPAQNLFILELMYTLMSLGFEGRYRVMERGSIALEALRDKVYSQIRMLRGDPQLDLSPKFEHNTFKNRLHYYTPMWLMAILLIVCTGVIFFGFYWTLNKRAERVFEQYVPVSAAINSIQMEKNGAINNR